MVNTYLGMRNFIIYLKKSLHQADRQTDRQTDEFSDMGACGFFISVKFSTFLLTSLAGGKN